MAFNVVINENNMESEKKEADQLLRKIKTFQSYLKSSSYNKLSNLEKNLCHQQLGAMQTYHKCLSSRLTASAETIDLRIIRCLDHHELGCKICF